MRLRMEVVAMFYEGRHPEHARIAAELVAPIYAEEKPGERLITIHKDGQLMLGFMTEVDLEELAE